MICLYASASAAAICVPALSTPSAIASAAILEAPSPLFAIAASATLCAPLANGGKALPCANAFSTSEVMLASCPLTVALADSSACCACTNSF